ncbi:MAG TPA: BTAD domain-containing putative transcriptional regulator, partial [Candidatus Udaeobacter sp.]|nr:BTAD domain-containing putative transcriptional regulator [Candidatus Udaeobacter sp.]
MTSPIQSPWHIQMLGTFTARRGRQEVVRFRTRKMASLLAYLSCHKQQAHPREGVIERFWPDVPAGAGRQSLSQALCALRHQLEGPGVERGAVIVADRLTVRLDPRAVTTDVAEFERALDEAQNAPDGSAARRLRLKSAHGVYQGEFLPGYYDDWVLAERTRLSELHLGVLVGLGLEHERAGERDRAIQLARIAIASDPWCEEQHRTLMRLLAESGHATAACEHYRELVARWQTELDADPEPQTTALFRAIQAGAFQARAGTGAPTCAEAPGVSPGPCALAGTVTFLLAQGVDATRATIDAVREHQGDLVRSEPAAGVAVFARAADALAAARCVAAQGPIALALHTGDLSHPPSRAAADAPERFLGAALDRAERLLDLGHPGQILLSEPTARLLESDLSAELQLVDLGIHRLPAARLPERLFQIAERNRPVSFPPLKAPRALSSQVPLQLTRFFGREAELAQIKILLESPSIRLLTLVGPGGTGKTRLALEAASQAATTAAAGGVCFVPLGDLTDPEHLPGAVLEALQRPLERSAEPRAALASALQGSQVRIVLDNLEHLLPRAAEIVAQLLASAPGLSLIATSRRPLGVNGEWRFLVPPLAVPEAPGTLAELAAFE